MALALCGLVACNGNGPDKDGLTEVEKEMKAVVEQYVPDVVYSIYKDLADESNNLYELLADATEKGPGNVSQSDMDAICAQFLQARQSWEESEAFLFGAASDFSIDPHIDTWPLDLDALVVALSNKEQLAMLEGEDGIAYANGKLGAELLGFHGIEYILFRDGKNRSASELTKDELIYVTAVAGDLRNCCYQLYVSWNAEAGAKYADLVEDLEVPTTVGSKSYGENMLGATKAGSTYETWQEVCAEILVGGCSNIANEVANVKMGNAHSGEDVNYIESPYSHKSFQDFIDNVLSIQYSLYGKSMATSAQEHSLMGLFKNHGYSGAAALESSISSAIAALKACQSKGAFVEIYQDSSVQTAMDAVNALDTELNKAASWVVLQ